MTTLCDDAEFTRSGDGLDVYSGQVGKFLKGVSL